MTSDPEQRPGVTSKLEADQGRTLIIPGLGTFDSRFAAAEVTYHPAPSKYRSIPNAPVWRILLKFGSTGLKVVAGLDVHGDVVFGRGYSEEDSPDVDLSNLGALERGVSRRHALLRPTVNKLYIIDLNSTNGTYVNAVPVSKGMAQTLRNHDALAFAGLNCIVEVLSSPSSRQGQPITASTGMTAPLDVSQTLKLGKPTVGKETVMGVKLPDEVKSADSGRLPPMTLSDLDSEPEKGKEKVKDEK